jgi:methionyl-tRNA formyltransferase
VDVILNVHSLFVMNGDVVSAPRIGSFNMHPGPLPRYAGLNAVSWALYRGETRHGVTIHKMEPAIDTGPIVYQSLFGIEANDTALSVFVKCIKAGVALMLQLLKTASAGADAIPLAPQDLAQREYFGAGIPHEGRLPWSLPAREIVNFARACDFYPFPSPWGYARSTMGGKDIAIVKTRLTGQPCDAPPGTVGQVVGSGVHVAGGDAWIEVNKLVVDGRSVNPAELLKPGDRFVDEP